jgi:predicted nucleotidyltransferase
MQQSAPVLLPIFRSRLQGDVLARTLGEPERAFTVVDLARACGADASTVTRELTRLVGVGLLSEERVGRTRVVRANTASPFFPELASLVVKAFGPARLAAEAFAPVKGVVAVVVFGSWAARAAGEPGPAPRDLDVLLVGTVSRVGAHRVADELSERLAVPVQVTFATQQEWVSSASGIVGEIRRRPHQEFPTPVTPTDLDAEPGAALPAPRTSPAGPVPSGEPAGRPTVRVGRR